MKFQEVLIGQSFKNSNGKPMQKISKTDAKSLVSEYTGFNFQEEEIGRVYTVKLLERVYDVK